MRLICTSIVTTLVLAGTSFAATINVPADQPTIEAAINASVNGDVIQVDAGAYYEANLNPGGKTITIQGALNSDGSLATSINAQHDGNVFVINSGESSRTMIKDLAITGGTASFGSYGGGIYCDGSSPTISGCTISNNMANNFGGGIYCANSSPTITGCTIENNTAINSGSGIHCYYSNPTITGCTIQSNTGANQGGGIYCESSSPTITDCAIKVNGADAGGGIALIAGSPTITDCTISGNEGDNCGGGIYCAGSNPIHSGCSFSFNFPDNVYGDPGWNPLVGDGNTPGIITLENCTICGTGEHVVGLILHLGHNHISDCTDEGDLDGDGDVDTDDLDALHAVTGICQSDVDHDGNTDVLDLLSVIENWGGTCP